MAVTPNSLTVTALSLVNAAAQEIGTLAQGEMLSSDDLAWGLQKLQRVIDTFNAKRTMVYANTFTQFALTANIPFQTIGPTGNISVNQRPEEIPSIGLVLSNTTPDQVEIYLAKRDRDWWALNAVKQVTSSVPTDYYYEQDWPLGKLYLWPVPNQTNGLLIQQRSVIPQMTTPQTTFTMPPGYWDAIVYTLAVRLAPSFGATVSPELQDAKADALRALMSNNIQSPRGNTGDAGMPGVGGGSGFNYVSAQPGSGVR